MMAQEPDDDRTEQYRYRKCEFDLKIVGIRILYGVEIALGNQEKILYLYEGFYGMYLTLGLIHTSDFQGLHDRIVRGCKWRQRTQDKHADRDNCKAHSQLKVYFLIAQNNCCLTSNRLNVTQA